MSRVLLKRLARLQARIDGRDTREAVIIVGADQAECDEQLKRAGVAGRVTGREPVMILTGVPRNPEGIA